MPSEADYNVNEEIDNMLPEDTLESVVLSTNFAGKIVVKVSNLVPYPAVAAIASLAGAQTKSGGTYKDGYYVNLVKGTGAPCVHITGSVIYGILRYAKLAGVKADVVVVKIGSYTFFTNSPNVMVLINKKLPTCSTEHFKGAQEPWKFGPPLGEKVFLGEAPSLMSTLEASLSMANDFKLKPAKKPKKLSKMGWNMITPDPLEGPEDLTGTVNDVYKIKKRSVMSAVAVFYMVEEMYATNPSIKPRRDVYVEMLARTMFDYLAGISFTEARHGKGLKWECYSSGDMDRSKANKIMRKYNPKQFLPVVHQIYKEEGCWGNGGFGGHPWAKIAAATSLYFGMPKGAWLDHVVDLSHHGGLAFDKGYIWNPPSSSGAYKAMLDAKRDDSIFFDTYQIIGHCAEFDFKELKWLLWVTGAPDEGPVSEKLNWGDETLVVEMNKDYMEDDDDEQIRENEAEAQETQAPKAIWHPERLE